MGCVDRVCCQGVLIGCVDRVCDQPDGAHSLFKVLGHPFY